MIFCVYIKAEAKTGTFVGLMAAARAGCWAGDKDDTEMHRIRFQKDI